MNRTILSVILLAALLLGFTAATATAQAFPTKPIQMIVPFAPGGSSDQLARAVEKIWPKHSKQPLVVVNKTGGGGVVGTEYVVRSKADGYTIYLGYGSGHDLVMPHLQKMPYKPTDLVPLVRLSIHSVAICTGEKSEYTSLKDVIDWAKKENKPITASVSTKAGAVDIVMGALSKMTGIKIVTVPGAGGADAATMLAGGHVMIGGGHPSEIMPLIRSGRFKPLAIARAERDPVLPNIPTVKEAIGIELATWGSVKGVAAPAKTPKAVVSYFEQTFKKVCDDPDFKKIMDDLGQPINYLNSADMAKFMQRAYADYGKLIKDLNIKL